jgi:hypothetical protein
MSYIMLESILKSDNLSIYIIVIVIVILFLFLRQKENFSFSSSGITMTQPQQNQGGGLLGLGQQNQGGGLLGLGQQNQGGGLLGLGQQNQGGGLLGLGQQQPQQNQGGFTISGLGQQQQPQQPQQPQQNQGGFTISGLGQLQQSQQPQQNQGGSVIQPVGTVSGTDSYFMYGPLIENDQKYLPAKLVRENGKKFYILEDGQYTKIIDENGVGKYYAGKMNEFNMNKWNSLSNLPSENYKLRKCPVMCAQGCDEINNCDQINPSQQIAYTDEKINAFKNNKYFMYDPWPHSENKQYTPMTKIIKGGKTFYIANESPYIKIMDELGTVKYYLGTMDQFDEKKWNNYINADRNYKLRECPATCKLGCDENKNCFNLIPNVTNKSNYFLYGPWAAGSNKYYTRSSKILRGNKIFYITEEGPYTKIVDDYGVAKNYEGTMDEFDDKKWNTYSDAQDNYRIRECPINCLNGCDETKDCSNTNPLQPPKYKYSLCDHSNPSKCFYPSKPGGKWTDKSVNPTMIVCDDIGCNIVKFGDVSGDINISGDMIEQPNGKTKVYVSRDLKWIPDSKK